MIQGEKQTKEIILNYDIAHILIQKVDGKLKADVQLKVTDQDNNFIESLVTTYTGEEYNTWWDNFNDWKTVFIDALKTRNVTIPDNIDQNYVNISEKPTEEELNP